jgi:hypothetical protein
MIDPHGNIKKQGRPKGSKDKQPRVRHVGKLVLASIQAIDVGCKRLTVNDSCSRRPCVSCNVIKTPTLMPCLNDKMQSLDDTLFAIFEDSRDSPNQYQFSMAADPFRNDWAIW